MFSYYESYRYSRGQRGALPLKGWKDERQVYDA
jgi:hypothetical protein